MAGSPWVPDRAVPLIIWAMYQIIIEALDPIIRVQYKVFLYCRSLNNHSNTDMITGCFYCSIWSNWIMCMDRKLNSDEETWSQKK
jgi:hypothetical protein